MGLFRHIKDLMRQNLWRYVLGVIVLIAIDGAMLVPPWIIGNIVDRLIKRELPTHILVGQLLFMIVLEAFVFLFRFLWRLWITGASREIETGIRQRYFGHLEKLSLDFYIQNKTGDLMARATNDLNAVRMAMGMGVIMITDATFMTITTVAVMLAQVDVKLTLFSLMPLPFLAFTIALMGKAIQHRHREVNESFSTLSERAREAFSGIRIVKSFVREQAIVDVFNQDNHTMLKANLRLVSIWGFMFPLIGFIASTSLVIALYFGGNAVLEGTLSIGGFVTFISYLGILTWPFMAIGWVINVLQRGVASMQRINEILDAKVDIQDDEPLEVSRLYGDIVAKDLSFAYPTETIPTLKHVSFELKRGQTLAILGRTGSGKTTLVNLLMRLYNPPRGTLFIDGHDIRDLKLTTLRSHIGFVPQTSFLFSKSIRENIAITDFETKDKKVAHYAKIAGIASEIEALPQGYSTLLGERGVNLSGGQKQRLAIARALIENPDMIIMDDALSAVDTRTEETILNHLKQELKDRTTLLVSHRVSTIQHADLILVLDNGHVSQSGTHQELIALDGFYRDLYEKQQLEERIADYS